MQHCRNALLVKNSKLKNLFSILLEGQISIYSYVLFSHGYLSGYSNIHPNLTNCAFGHRWRADIMDIIWQMNVRLWIALMDIAVRAVERVRAIVLLSLRTHHDMYIIYYWVALLFGECSLLAWWASLLDMNRQSAGSMYACFWKCCRLPFQFQSDFLPLLQYLLVLLGGQNFLWSPYLQLLD